jgi:ribose transport system substrate-binding protein
MKNKTIVIIGIASLLLTVADPAFRKAQGADQGVEPICWYGMIPHPYFSLVQKGAEAAAKDYDVRVYTTLGQEFTQDNETQNVEALSARGYKGFSIFPTDPAGGNALFQELKKRGQFVVAYGAEPNLPTAASFTVGTDIKGAAMRACEDLIKIMGDKGNILNVLEMVTNVNTTRRNEGIKEVVAKHPNVHIIQTVSDMTTVGEATTKIQGGLAARGEEIDGMIATGYNPTVAAAAILTEWHKDPKHKRIHFIGVDTDKTVIQAIREGNIDGTIAQNPFAHGYIPIALLKLMLDGWKPVKPYQFVEAGDVLVTRANTDTYEQEISAITDKIKKDLTTKYLTKEESKN